MIKSDKNGVVINTPSSNEIVFWIEATVIYCQDWKRLDYKEKDLLKIGALYDSFKNANKALSRALFEQKLRTKGIDTADLKKLFKSAKKNNVESFLYEYKKLYSNQT